MDDYKEFLMKMNVTDLKDLVRRYNLKTKIKMTGIKKIDLINQIHTHTHMKDGRIHVKDEVIPTEKIKKKHLTEKQIEAGKRRTKKAFEKLKEKTKHLFFDDVSPPQEKTKKGETLQRALDELKMLLDEDV